MVASRYMNRKESSLPVDLRHPKTSLLKLLTTGNHFEVVRGTGTVLYRSALWDCFRNAIVSFIGQCKVAQETRLKFFNQKYSQSAIRNSIWPIERRSVTSRYHGSKIFG